MISRDTKNSQISFTIAHSRRSLQQCQPDEPPYRALARDVEDDEDEDEGDGGLANQDQELGHNVGDKDFRGEHAGNPRSKEERVLIL